MKNQYNYIETNKSQGAVKYFTKHPKIQCFQKFESNAATDLCMGWANEKYC